MINTTNKGRRTSRATRAIRPQGSNTNFASDKAEQSTNRHGRDYSILVHSHLRWDWVWQRPQQFLSRLSHRHPILFVEEPLAVDGVRTPRAELRNVDGLPNVTVLRTEFPPALMNDRSALDSEQKRLVLATLAGPLGRVFTRPVQWFYDPMATLAFAGQMNERATVYDCMDQLSQFRGAPPELIRRERELLTIADVVFAGGPKIHKAKRLLNPNCHSYGCGVDVRHFGRALLPETEIPQDIANLSGPRLGFFGVVDERMDYPLVAHLAESHPDWNVIIIGPFCKIDPATLPQRPNLHWLGARDYGQLPAYVKGLDVCLMPFAINEATEFINPTKALEYMATGRPIVSTPVEDVVLQFADVVHLAATHDEFVSKCERAIAAADPGRIQEGLRMAERNSWEAIVAELEAHIDAVLAKRELSEVCAA